MTTEDYDQITSFLGEWGTFQWTVFLLLSLSTVPNGYAGMSMVFLSDTPAHHCKLPLLNGSLENLTWAIPEKEIEGVTRPSTCSRYKWINNTGAQLSNVTEGCLDGWEYSTDQYDNTIVTEWNLVCEESWKVPFSLSIFFMGVLTGSFISGQISDRFGRKVTLFVTMAVQTLSSLVQVASFSWEMFCVFFFITGIGQISNYVAAYVLGCELLGKSSRVTFSTLGVCVFYGIGYALLPLFAYFIRSWRVLLAALSLPGLLYIPLWWFIPESPRWLLTKGRVEEAEAILRAAAKKNGITPPAVIFKQAKHLVHKGELKNEPTYTYLDLVRTRKMRNVTVLNCAIWFIITISYFGLSLNTPNMHGDPYLNCLLFAVMEIAASVGVWLVLKVVPRRIVIATTLMTAGTVLLFIHLISTEYSVLGVVLAMSAKFGITAAFSVLYVSAAEQFPTVVRGMGMGLCSMSSKIGSTISPFFPYMGQYNKVLPYILMGFLTVSAGLLSVLIPETSGIDLPEDLSQVQTLNWCCLWCKKQPKAIQTCKTFQNTSSMENSQLSCV
ncbi:solute carrier family 22 member 4 [Chanos chanos]|uniref:Solute carrier family 22 member 4 n=1 Tax=Chanos chanos TaxID=29144 RepID=A0A6J2UNB8_CHACN|nr:solute carrier family 22 member 4-like [Chanos chanos]